MGLYFTGQHSIAATSEGDLQEAAGQWRLNRPDRNEPRSLKALFEMQMSHPLKDTQDLSTFCHLQMTQRWQWKDRFVVWALVILF